MKKTLLIFACGIILGLSSSGQSTSQGHPFVVQEYMHVKPGNDDAYLQVENFWKHIHQAQREKGNIISWSVWKVVAPYDMNAPYQYVVSTVYSHFYNYLNAYKDIDIHKVFPDASKDSLKKMFNETPKARDLIKADIFYAEDHVFDSKTTNAALVSYIKVTPEKADSFHAFMKNHRRPIVSEVVKKGFADAWWYGNLMFGKGADSPYNYIVCVQWAGDSMFDKVPPFAKYKKKDPVAFQGYKLFTEDHDELLYRMVSLDDRSK